MNVRSPDEWQQWLDDFSRGESTEAWRGIMCFLRWIQIRSENGHPVPNFLPAIEGDIFHSHLLRRMLAGKEPFDNPPPESYGQPWYELVETGQSVTKDVEPWEWAPEQKISINKGIWTIIKKNSDQELVVQYKLNPERYLLKRTASDTWTMQRM
ncbi:MAG: hypothetical protein R3B84_04010 [Zavarzinella sp.]